MIRLSSKERWFLALAMVAMAAQCLPWISDLGMDYDESHFLPTAAAIVAKNPEVLRPPDGFTIDGRPFPFMTMPYLGGLDGWLMAIPVGIFGFHQAVPRAFNVCLGLVVLWLTYLLGRRYGGPLAGGIAVGMLIVDLEFLLHVPVHFGPFLIQMICSASALLLLERWLEDGRTRWFYWACFLAGLAFQEKLTFLWVVALLVVFLMLFRGKEILARLTLKQLATGLGVFLLGMLPVLWYMIGRPEVVFGFGKAAASPATWETLAKRFYTFHLLLTGQEFLRLLVSDTPPLIRVSALEWMMWAAIPLAVFQRNWKSLMLLLFTVSMVVVNALFPEGGRLHHLLLVYPMLQVGVALAFARWRWSTATAIVLLAATGVSTAQNITFFTREAKRTGGHYHWSSAIYDAAGWIRSQPDQHFLATSWGMQRQIMFLTGGRASIRDLYFELLPDPVAPDMRELVASLAKRRNSYWITSRIVPQYTENLNKLFAIAKGEGLTPRLVREFHTKTGEPIYQVYSFHPEEPQTAWTPLDGAMHGSTELEAKLPAGTTEARFRLTARKWNRGTALRVELAGEDGKWYAAWWRPLRFRQMVWPDQILEFGNDAYPDDFVVLPGTRPGADARYLRVFVDTEGKPVDLTLTDLAVR